MRKAFMIALLAATAAVPTAAMAQDGDNARAERREARQAERAARGGGDNSAQRQENRQQRQEYRQQRQEQRRAERPQQQAPAASQQRQWLGDPNDRRMEAHRERYEQIERRNAARNGTRQQYNDVVQQQRADQRSRVLERGPDFRQQERRDDRREWRQERRDDRRDWRQDRRDDRRDWRQDRRDDRRDWNRGWRNDNRYDWQRYRNSNRFVFRVQPYYSPYRGYSYRRFSIGNTLDRLFWDQNYWISDPYQYRLPPAPYGYQWVRYYNDVVLVDTWSGQIVDVIYDFFW